MLSFLKLLLTLAGTVAKYLSDQKLLDAGEAKAIAENLQKAKIHVEKADNARRNVSLDADSLRNDPNDRANNKWHMQRILWDSIRQAQR